MEFLNYRISTLSGIIILLIISFAVGLAIQHQMKEIMSIRVQALEME
ncbi:hypothetical protein KKC65_03210 [Patescibacteria group bacterium]|nr:hypothetical protein [Patescibacteria group bacterium]